MDIEKVLTLQQSEVLAKISGTGAERDDAEREVLLDDFIAALRAEREVLLDALEAIDPPKAYDCTQLNPESGMECRDGPECPETHEAWCPYAIREAILARARWPKMPKTGESIPPQ